MDTETYHLVVIVGTVVGFFTLAALLLVPIYKFLGREEQASREWTRQRLAERQRQHRRSSSNGAEADNPRPDRPDPAA